VDEVAKVPVRIVKTPKSVKGFIYVEFVMFWIAWSGLRVRTCHSLSALLSCTSKCIDETHPRTPLRAPVLTISSACRAVSKLHRILTNEQTVVHRVGRGWARSVGREGRAGPDGTSQSRHFVEPFTHGGDCRDSLTLRQAAARFFILTGPLQGLSYDRSSKGPLSGTRSVRFVACCNKKLRKRPKTELMLHTRRLP